MLSNKQDLADMMAKGSKTRWGNLIGYILLPFSIALQDDPLDYVRQAKATIDRKKLSLEAILTFVCAELVLRIFGVKVCIIFLHLLSFKAAIGLGIYFQIVNFGS
jgi:hypothetical protein